MDKLNAAEQHLALERSRASAMQTEIAALRVDLGMRDRELADALAKVEKLERHKSLAVTTIAEQSEDLHGALSHVARMEAALRAERSFWQQAYSPMGPGTWGHSFDRDFIDNHIMRLDAALAPTARPLPTAEDLAAIGPGDPNAANAAMKPTAGEPQ